MKPQQAILRLGELTLKGRNRHRFENTIFEQVKRTLRSFEAVSYRKEFGRIILQLNGTDYEELMPYLRKVLGLTSFSPVYSSPLELERIQETALGVIQSLKPLPRTYKVSVRRVNKSFPHDSQEMNRLVGGCVLRAFPDLKVDVHRPEAELRVEIREREALLYCRVDEGAGGFPVGSNGKAMLMLSGGIDSPVAGYFALRQGLQVEAVHFHSYPYTNEKSQQKVIELARKLAAFAGPVKLHMVSFTSVQTKIHAAYNQNLLIALLRRAMLRITEKLAEERGAGAIVTGESLGQVASQTLSSMNTIGRAVSLPLIRPLVCMEKREIIRVAEGIGTFPISILPHEDCCTLFLPPSPSTNPNLRVVESIESKMTWLEDELEEAVRNTRSLLVDEEDVVNQRDKFASFF
ncbi:tRNA 4-thiouridine(8) synthase ThiI [Paenibacillus naphthalenovorans]|uniref:tRNA uracil 4-sulfurtransferase ThiI n=1 Tax=Paenibacillus naphthalenovorans TaxID=162209 RepID=UPI0010B1E654|nr:tRNA uracil 4-sulfurtransferase ThiI [Paenibacillus naphthalenovorans]GCL72588.1 tRNA 4-thiouridine(8) synthase ThiI [Paenibacillus naphthalenovorans]